MANGGRVWMGLIVAVALATSVSAAWGQSVSSDAAAPNPIAVVPTVPKPQHTAPVAAKAAALSAEPAAATAPAATAADSVAVASENAEYHDELMSAAASLKADIQAESDASAAAVDDGQSGPTRFGLIVAGGVILFAILVAVIVIPASLRARRKRREMLNDMLSGKPPHKR